jgi:hypothetical protein
MEEMGTMGIQVYQWHSYQEIPSIKTLFAFHSIHHAGRQSLMTINEKGPPQLCIQEHLGQLSYESFVSLHRTYGDEPRYLLYLTKPSLLQALNNYLLVYEEVRAGKDEFLILLRRRKGHRGIRIRAPGLNKEILCSEEEVRKHYVRLKATNEFMNAEIY